MSRKTLLSLLIGIIAFLVAYLTYINYERRQSITLYFDDPRIGDIYKIQQEDEGGVSWIYYMKVINRTDAGLLFARSRMKSDASTDYLLKHFNKEAEQFHTYRQLAEIKQGKWKNFLHDHTTLIEIKRR